MWKFSRKAVFPTWHLKLTSRGSLRRQEPGVVGMVRIVAREPHLAKRNAALEKNESEGGLE